MDMKRIELGNFVSYVYVTSILDIFLRDRTWCLFFFFLGMWTLKTEKANKETDFELGSFLQLIEFSVYARGLPKVQIWKDVTEKWNPLFT